MIFLRTLESNCMSSLHLSYFFASTSFFPLFYVLHFLLTLALSLFFIMRLLPPNLEILYNSLNKLLKDVQTDAVDCSYTIVTKGSKKYYGSLDTPAFVIGVRLHITTNQLKASIFLRYIHLLHISCSGLFYQINITFIYIHIHS